VKETRAVWAMRGQPVHAGFGSEREGSQGPEDAPLHSSDKALKQ